MGTHPIFESDFDCLTEKKFMAKFSVLALLGIAQGYFVTVQPRKEECFHEYVKNNDKINMMYEVAEGGFLDINVKVINAKNQVIYNKERETSGKMLFTADMQGPIRFCFNNKISTVTHKVVMFSIDVTEAAAAGEEDEDETHSKLETMMGDLASQMTTVKHEQEYMEVRERIHRAINENTNSRVVLWAFFESLVLIAMTVGQVYYLKRFFEVRRVV